MKSISTSDLSPLRFNPGNGTLKQAHRAVSGKIGWLRSISEKPGMRYDLVIRDALGRVKFRKENCGNEGINEYGELVNLPTQLGEELEIEVENVRGEGSVDIFLN